MKYSTYRFTLDLQKHQSQISIAVFQYDTAVRLYISLTDGGIPYHIADGCRAVFYGKRPDGTDLIHTCMIEGNTRIVYDFNDQTACSEGTVDAQICLYGIDGELITAPRLIIVVSERTVNPANIDLEGSPLSALEQIIASETSREIAEVERDKAENGVLDDGLGYTFKGRVQVEQERVLAEEARANAEVERTAAETLRLSAEENRVASENQRSEAETARITAETERIVAESSRVKAEKERKSAEDSRSNTIGTIINKIGNVEFILEQFGVINEQIDKTTAYSKAIPKNSDLYFYLNSFGGMTYRNLIKFPPVINTLDGAVTIAKTDDGLILNGTGIDSSTSIGLIYPDRDWGGKFYLTVKEPLPEGVTLKVWCGPPGMDSMVYTMESGSVEGSFDGYGNISIEFSITGTMNNVLIAPCLSYGKPMLYGDEPTSTVVEAIGDEIDLWNGMDYELGTLDSSTGADKEQTPYSRSGYIEIPSGIDVFGIVRGSEDVTTEIRVFYYDASKTYLSNATLASDANSITFVNNAKYIRIRLKRTSSRVLDKTLKLESFGAIIWDGTAELGSISTSSSSGGTDSTTTCGARSDYLPLPITGTYNVTYGTYDSTVTLYFYNSAKAFISKATPDKTTMTITSPSKAAYVRILLSKAYEYGNDVSVYKDWTELLDVTDFERLEAYGCGLDELAYNKIDLESGVYKQYVDEDGEPLSEPDTVNIKDMIVELFGGLEPLIKVTKNRTVTFVNDNKNPVPSVITYNIIQEG